MKVNRVSFPALRKILQGEINEEALCIIKFYSNTCKYCHALQEYYEELAESYEDVHFFAYNTDDAGMLDKHIKIDGVPSIVSVKNSSGLPPKINILGEPERPNKFTWYRMSDLRHFIKEQQ
tara:strand:+ start:5071 stop:5433 length:363 start_codon:yes stop_codon:yes gene_type:complete